MISATIVGNLGADAQTKQLPTGDSVVEFNVACKVAIQKDAPPEWVRCSIWGRRGATLLPHLVRGSRVVVRGALLARPYAPKSGGDVRAGLELRVDDIEFAGGGERRAASPAPGPTGDTQAPPDQDIPF